MLWAEFHNPTPVLYEEGECLLAWLQQEALQECAQGQQLTILAAQNVKEDFVDADA